MAESCTYISIGLGHSAYFERATAEYPHDFTVLNNHRGSHFFREPLHPISTIVYFSLMVITGNVA